VRLSGICLITPDVPRLRTFYAAILGVPATGDDTFAELETSGLSLSMFAEAGMEGMAPGVLAGAGRGALTIEVEVDDVDAELARLRPLEVAVAKPPSTQTWGRRSVWLRDPDGNLVNLYAHVSAR
jgi:catechol 2,3-dioxygenase-like lactoylglutathione lyase family enzyme